MQLARMHRVAEQNVESLNAAQLKHLVRKPSTATAARPRHFTVTACHRAKALGTSPAQQAFAGVCT